MVRKLGSFAPLPLLAALLSLHLGAALHAGEPAAAPGEAAIPRLGDVHGNEATVVRLGQRLRCPVCQGMSIGDSPSPMAQDMMRQVRRMRAEGQSEADIVAYFTARYGEWVLLDPPKSGVGLWVWILPPIALALGTGFVGAGLRRRARAAQAAVAPKPAASAAGATSLTETELAEPCLPNPSCGPGPEPVNADLQAIRREMSR